MPGMSSADTARMENQMKAMQQMHDKMAAAKTPEERNALMAEHQKTIQDGMTMMKGMAPDGMKGEMGMRHQFMEKRMEMMQAMMQMMTDRMPADAPSK